MAKKTKKKTLNNRVEIEKWKAIGAWAVPVAAFIELIRTLLNIFNK